jgi:hypothetical protein
VEQSCKIGGDEGGLEPPFVAEQTHGQARRCEQGNEQEQVHHSFAQSLGFYLLDLRGSQAAAETGTPKPRKSTR